MRSRALAILLVSTALLAGPSAEANVGLGNQVRSLAQRLRSSWLTHRIEKQERAAIPQVERAQRALAARGITADAPITVVSPLRRNLLASMAQEYRLLAGAKPGSWAARRRGTLAPFVGSSAAIAQEGPMYGKYLGVTVPTAEGAHIGIRTGQTYTETVNTLAHEMKHARDMPREQQRLAQLSALQEDNARLRQGKQTRSVRKQIAQNQAWIDYDAAVTSRPALETRAYAHGAYGQAMLGQRLDGTYRAAGPGYPSHDIAAATLRGYAIGTKRALRTDARFMALDPEDRAIAGQKISAYAFGYEQAAMVRAEKWMHYGDDKPSLLSRLARPIARGFGALVQKLQPISSELAAYDAGRRDAEHDRAPQGRAAQLFKP